MSAYAPRDPQVVAMLCAALVGVLGAAFAISRVRSLAFGRAAAWSLVIGSVLLADRLATDEPPGVRMLAIVGLLLYAMKGVVSVETPGCRLPPLRWLAFAAGWPGMRPALFAKGTAPLPGAGALAGMGLVWIVCGAALLFAARGIWIATGSRAAATAALLPGISLVVHFGVFNLLAGGWRRFGVDAEPLFKAPLRSRSLREFWGRRWNLAFSEMTAAGVYRPVAGIAGRPAGVAAAFFASGLLHEIAISLPVRAGYGLPLLYFALHGTLMLAERALEQRGRPISAVVWVGRTWTIFWLAAPLPILFHPPFLDGAIWPLLGMQR